MTFVRRLLLLLFACVALPGCVGVPHEPGEVVRDGALTARLRAIWPRHEHDLRAVHRAMLEARGRQYSYTAYALVRPAGDIRLVAIDDFGGTVFETLLVGGELKLLRNVGLPRELLDALTRDMEILYLERPSAASELVRHKGGRLALVERWPDHEMGEFVVDEGYRPARYVRVRRRRCVYAADFAPRGGTESVRIVNYVLGYRLRLELRDIREAPLPDAFFTGTADDRR